MIAFQARSIDSVAHGAAYRQSKEKQYLDMYGAKVLQTLTHPIMKAARFAVHAEDGSPDIVYLPRVGKDGIFFEQQKIRTMVKGSEKQPIPPTPKEVHDPRITRLGRFLRKTSIDELPQLNNVIAGHMSLAGPRPKPVEIVEHLSRLDPEFYPSYTASRPGLTGLEQIRGRGACDDVTKIECAKEYEKESCLALDIDILIKTAKIVATRDGAY